MEDITNIFSSRLKYLRGNRNQDDVAKELGISRASLSYYETGARKPDINTLYALAKYYNVSSDYLLGLSEASSPRINTQAIVNQTGLSELAVYTLERLRCRSAKTSAESNSQYKDSKIASLLQLEVINLLLHPSNDLLLDDLANYLFVHFTHFSNWDYEDDPEDKICNLALHDRFLNYTYSKDYDFFSNAFLLLVQRHLQELRQHYTSKISDRLWKYDFPNLKYNDLYDVLIDFFHVTYLQL